MITGESNKLMDQVQTCLQWYVQPQVHLQVIERIVLPAQPPTFISTLRPKHASPVAIMKLMILILNDVSLNNITPC